MIAQSTEARPSATSEEFNPLDLLKDNPRIVSLEAGQILFSEGDTADCMYVVRTGKLRIRSGSVVYEDIGQGAIVGEMGLVEKKQQRSAMVYALSDSELIQVDEARFLELIAQRPRFALTVMQVLSRRLRTMDRRYRPDLH